MALTVEAMAASVGLAAMGGIGSAIYFKPGKQLEPRPVPPHAAIRARLRLHAIDMLSYLFAAAGVLSLVPETLQAFAPELMLGGTLAGTALEHLDYLAFFFVSLSFGMGIARRVLLIALEKASLPPCP